MFILDSEQNRKSIEEDQRITHEGSIFFVKSVLFLSVFFFFAKFTILTGKKFCDFHHGSLPLGEAAVFRIALHRQQIPIPVGCQHLQQKNTQPENTPSCCGIVHGV